MWFDLFGKRVNNTSSISKNSENITLLHARAPSAEKPLSWTGGAGPTPDRLPTALSQISLRYRRARWIFSLLYVVKYNEFFFSFKYLAFIKKGMIIMLRIYKTYP